jgi:hypothetical protein
MNNTTTDEKKTISRVTIWLINHPNPVVFYVEDIRYADDRAFGKKLNWTKADGYCALLTIDIKYIAAITHEEIKPSENS